MCPKTAFSLHCYSYLAMRPSQCNIEYLLLQDSKVMFRTRSFEKTFLRFTARHELSQASFPPFSHTHLFFPVNKYMKKIEKAEMKPETLITKTNKQKNSPKTQEESLPFSEEVNF